MLLNEAIHGEYGHSFCAILVAAYTSHYSVWLQNNFPTIHTLSLAHPRTHECLLIEIVDQDVVKMRKLIHTFYGANKTIFNKLSNIQKCQIS